MSETAKYDIICAPESEISSKLQLMALKGWKPILMSTVVLPHRGGIVQVFIVLENTRTSSPA